MEPAEDYKRDLLVYTLQVIQERVHLEEKRDAYGDLNEDGKAVLERLSKHDPAFLTGWKNTVGNYTQVMEINMELHRKAIELNLLYGLLKKNNWDTELHPEIRKVLEDANLEGKIDAFKKKTVDGLKSGLESHFLLSLSGRRPKED